MKQIRRIRESHSQMTNIFLHGSCLNFHMILRAFYPEAEAWVNNFHVITKIGNRFYDITGEIIDASRYLPFKNYLVPVKRNTMWAKEMIRSEFLLDQISS